MCEINLIGACSVLDVGARKFSLDTGTCPSLFQVRNGEKELTTEGRALMKG